MRCEEAAVYWVVVCLLTYGSTVRLMKLIDPGMWIVGTYFMGAWPGFVANQTVMFIGQRKYERVSDSLHQQATG